MTTTNATLAFIGCGNMGSAILNGLLEATRDTPNPPINTFNVSTKTTTSAERLRSTLAPADQARVRFTPNDNITAMANADIILLACKPFLAESILSQRGVWDAAKNKLIISVMAGPTVAQILGYMRPRGSGPGGEVVCAERSPTVVRVQPNVAARLRQSMTVVEVDDDSEEGQQAKGTVEWIFKQVGDVRFVAPSVFEVSSLLVGASMAWGAIALDGVLDGCVAGGLRRPEALEMAAQTLAGMAALLKDGAHPAVLREGISSPRGCTIQGILELERAGVRGSFADALLKGVEHLQR
ncbi:pyrroline-5-carboxylate reductase [Aspergillus campestris IBT 28561]|uniref:Pyrroline-5-carboxylate reductase n=1 Tax=Aspergillus campestris (strain IBT 28561) TaxID=1392248 RepID=A0A2I1CWM8_ASPC2|nr:pyrroline-5-carboxylate reductase [Aspergillus campestris IBT 28561]PKY02031.1 pyrroline-5-carboxylate reductase [Aspergillus campestris IBT 28561]